MNSNSKMRITTVTEFKYIDNRLVIPLNRNELKFRVPFVLQKSLEDPDSLSVSLGWIVMLARQ